MFNCLLNTVTTLSLTLFIVPLNLRFPPLTSAVGVIRSVEFPMLPNVEMYAFVPSCTIFASYNSNSLAIVSTTSTFYLDALKSVALISSMTTVAEDAPAALARLILYAFNTVDPPDVEVADSVVVVPACPTDNKI